MKLRGETVLIVEDEPLIALDVHAIASEDGASVIAALSCKEAKKMATSCDISVAILDVRLDNEDCTELICHHLRARKIPFMFYTGFNKHEIMSMWPDVPVIEKPASQTLILEGMRQLLFSKKVNANRTQKEQV